VQRGEGCGGDCHWPRVRTSRDGRVGTGCELEGVCWLAEQQREDAHERFVQDRVIDARLAHARRVYAALAGGAPRPDPPDLRAVREAAEEEWEDPGLGAAA
jgi:hypothetical protein